MTISTRRTEAAAPRARAGFTLTEVIVAATLSTFMLAGILSAFLMIGRTGFLASAYSELEAETRRGLDVFGQDVRRAKDLRWNSSQSVTLTLPTATNATTLVTYAYDSTTSGATARCFYRVVGDAASVLPRRILIHNVAADFTFRRYKLEQEGVPDNTATNDPETKQLEVVFRATREGRTVVAANQAALSARYVLRNKRVAN